MASVASVDASSLRAILEAAVGPLGLALDGQQRNRLVAYVELIARWNRTYNLTSIREPRAMMTQHVVDSLAVIVPLRQKTRHLADRPCRVLDVGSGAGLPGVVLAIVETSLQVTCVDSVGKKAAFIQQVAATLGLANLRAVHARVESMAPPHFDVITSRAFAALHSMVTATRHLLEPDGWWMAMKGVRPDNELKELGGTDVAFHVEPMQTPGLNAARCIVWLQSSSLRSPSPKPLR